MYKRPSPLIQVLHPFLGEGRPDDVTRQIFHGRIISGRYAVAAEDVEAGMPPCCEHGDHLLHDLSFAQERPDRLMPEDGLQLFQLQGRGDAEHPIAIKAAVRDENMVGFFGLIGINIMDVTNFRGSYTIQ